MHSANRWAAMGLIAIVAGWAGACGNSSDNDSNPENEPGGTTPGDSAEALAAESSTLGGGAYPPDTSGPATVGGTITFKNIGAPGYWGRRIQAQPGDPRCDVESRTIDFGWGTEFCCRTSHEVQSNAITPYNEEMTLILRGPLSIKQLAVYQPQTPTAPSWTLRSSWDRRSPQTFADLKLTGPNGATNFTGDLGNACHWYAMRSDPFPCGPGSDPYCPGGGPDVNYHGWAGSKLVVMLASMPYANDPDLTAPSCASGPNAGWTDAPWIGFSASELMRDGWGKYHPCHCYANTNSWVGDGCGEINVFEVVSEAEGLQYGNRDIISTGLRSYQFGHLGGSVCGKQSCNVSSFPTSADLLDACTKTAAQNGRVLDANAGGGGCPVWRRPLDDRYFFVLLDEASRVVQVGVIHPQAIPAGAAALLPGLPPQIPRTTIDQLAALRLPQP